MESKISIILPFRNTANFIRDCLHSIVDQSYRHWELIAVNDHSSDESTEWVTMMAKKDPRIIAIDSSGAGIIPALRAGYEKSSGEYITRMDSDDLMVKDKLERMVECLQEKGKGHLALGLVSYFSEEKLGAGYQQYAAWLNDLTLQGKNFDDIYRECSIPSPCWMCLREDFELCGGFDSHTYPEDYDLAFRFKRGRLKVIGIPQILHHWRDYPTRTSRTDENYKDNRFSSLKVMHFVQQDYDYNMTLVLWGAGGRGKRIAKCLQDEEVLFKWICNNPKKIGRNIYDVILDDLSLLESSQPCQVIVAFSDADNKRDLEEILARRNHHSYFHFC